MIRVLTDNKFINCEKCNSLLGYEEKDTWISSNRGYSILDMNDFTYIKKFINCPVCSHRIIISEEEKWGSKNEQQMAAD